MKTTIQINGKLYDAKTGKVVANNSPNQISPMPTKPHNNGVVMDGVARRKSGSVVTNLNPSQVKPKPILHKTNQPYATDIFKPKNNVVNHHSHNSVHNAQKSQTLNRKAVKKPMIKSKPAVHTKVTTPVATMHSRVEHSATGRGMLLKKVPQNRLVRAINSPKSSLVTKFGVNRNNKPQLSPHLKVQQSPIGNYQPKINEPQLKNPVHQIDASTLSPKRSVFEDHLIKSNTASARAKKDANRKKYKKFKLSPKFVSITAVFVAFVLMGGFFAYQNIPSVGMRIAAQKAGFNGSLPGSVPAGYAFKSPILAESNNISVTYQNSADNRNFVLVQRPTNWSSESLLTNYLLDSQFRYQVYRDKGLTVYIYNGSNATWVDKGVWYSVTSEENSLSSEQLLELASSI
jgi:hypothetical protein